MTELIIRPLELSDQEAFMTFNALLLTEKATNPFVETVAVNDFLAHYRKLRHQETVPSAPDRSTVTTYFAFLDGEIVGKISCRWELDKGDLATVGGHIGYVTVPTYRRRGVAKQLLDVAFAEYKSRGIRRVFITALADNLPSRRTIERVGGVLQDIISLPTYQQLARYWVSL